jgi:hypothetical protein
MFFGKKSPDPVIAKRAGSITFRVDDVEPAKDLLPTVKTHEGLRELLGGPVESSCDYTAEVVRGVTSHSLVSAVHLAFAGHRPLVLSPDMVWLTLVQGVAHHIMNNAEELRPRLVAYTGKTTLVVDRPDFVRGSPENPWPEVFRAFSDLVRGMAKPEGYGLLVERFSTTGPVEQAAYEIALLDAFAPYFDYVLRCICGIPTVTLEGTVDDWCKIAEKAVRFMDWGLAWWAKELLPILQELARTAAGHVDRKFWQGIYKPVESYGGDVTTGWFAKLIPYTKDHLTGRASERNPLVVEGQGIRSDCLPSGLSQVPFVLDGKGGRRRMEFVSGVVGVTQDGTTRALRPKIGWAVREAPELDQLLLELSAHEVTPPLEASIVSERLRGADSMPGELVGLYLHCNGARIKARSSGKVVCTLYSVDQATESPGLWTLGELADGSRLGLLVDGREDWPVFSYTPGKPGARVPYAKTVREALRKILAGAT